MFFNRFGKTSVTKCPSKSPEPAASRVEPHRVGSRPNAASTRASRQRWALLGLAAAIAAPTGAMRLDRAYASEAAAGPDAMPDGRPNS
ncbi:MAG TPA: hypothetical protein VHY37_05660, partial [Tepidisphaeraceae bacterium]|nr:hypothetical protein [Tepidisphaeraceae bacterium]